MQQGDRSPPEKEGHLYGGSSSEKGPSSLSEPAIVDRIGQATVTASDVIDSNLRLFRAACLTVMAGSAAYLILRSPALRRYGNVADVPLEAFRRRERIPCRVLLARPSHEHERAARQFASQLPRERSETETQGPPSFAGGDASAGELGAADARSVVNLSNLDSMAASSRALTSMRQEEPPTLPGVFVAHSPLLRRLLRVDALGFGSEDVLCVRPFGVDLDLLCQRGIAERLEPDTVVTATLLYRDPDVPWRMVAHVQFRPPDAFPLWPFKSDLASDLITRGAARVATEEPGPGASHSLGHLQQLERRLRRLESSERRARSKRVGRWLAEAAEERQEEQSVSWLRRLFRRALRAIWRR